MLLVILLSITSVFAQTRQDSIESYNSTKNWAVVKLTLSYIEDFRSDFAQVKDISEIKNNEKKEYATYLKLRNKYGAYNDNVDLDAISQVLKEGSWKNAESKVFQKYKKDIIEGDMISYQTVGFSPNTIGEYREKALIEINKEYNSNIAGLVNLRKVNNKKNDATANIDSVKQTDANVNSRKVDTQQSNDNGIMFYLGIALFAVSILLNLFFIKKNLQSSSKFDKLNAKLRRMQKENEKFQYDLQNKSKQSRVSSNSNNEIDKLRKDNARLVQQLDEFKRKSSAQPISNSTTGNSVKKSKSSSSSIIYLPRPQDEGVFLKKHAKDEYDDRYLYQVNIDNNKSVGKLSLISNADFARALSSPERYFEKVCDYENEYSNNARSVIVVQKGEIQMQGEEWIVIKKLKIKFI